MQAFLDLKDYVINPEKHFSLPNINDFYAKSIDEVFYKSLSESLGEASGEMHKTAFYIDPPFTEELGYHQDRGVFVIRADADISDEAKRLGKFDGDTLYFDADTVNEGSNNRPFKVGNSEYNSFMDYLHRGLPKYYGKEHNYNFGLRFVGLDANEISHMGERNVPISDTRPTIEWFNIGEIRSSINKDDFVYRDHNYKDSNRVRFIRFTESDNRWFELLHDEQTGSSEQGTGNIRYVFVTSSENITKEDEAKGLKQQEDLQRIMNKAIDTRIVIDTTQLSNNPNNFPSQIFYEQYESTISNNMRKLFNRFVDDNIYKQTGFNLFGMDPYRRLMGAVYVKVPVSALPGEHQVEGEVWINVNKYIIAHNKNDVVVWPDYTDQPTFENAFGTFSDVFRLYSYSYKNRQYFDALGMSQEELDDRRETQRKITGRDFPELKQWTVMIGDSTLMVPPTSIRSVNRTATNQVPLMRAKGAMSKGQPKSQRMIELTLYFNGDHGINGVPYTQKLPNGSEQTYWMNGLRSLIAQFKLTPFLPIENSHINHVLNIDAVTLVNMQISTLPDYPKCMAATLTLQEFEYRVYMPELPVDVDRLESDETYNVFAAAINWPLFRWHYQQAIIRGDESIQYAFNSKEHMLYSFGGRTTLAPQKFDHSNVQFYIPNEEQLSRMKQIKIEAQKRALDSIVKLDDGDRALGEMLSGLTTAYSLTQELNEIPNIKRSFKSKEGFRIRTNSKDTWRQENIFFVQNDLYQTILDKETYGQNIIRQYGELIYRNFFETNSITPEYRVETSIKTTEKGYAEGRIDYVFDINLSNFTKSNVEQLARAAESFIDTEDKAFENSEIRISYKGTFKNIHSTNASDLQDARELYVYELIGELRLDSDHPDIKALKYTEILSMGEDEFQQTVLDMKQSIDEVTLESIDYELYDVGESRLTTAAVVMSNIVTEASLNGIDGYAPQFMGSHDNVIEMTIETTNPETAMLLQEIPRISSRMVRQYREVLPHWPLRIESQVTAMCGIYDVLIQSVEVNTVPNHPGFYQISIQLISVDRTLRNRESLKRLETPMHSGYTGVSMAESITIRDYFSLDDALANVPLYPDLELPTVEELENNGFYFIRHLNSRPDHYVDPDFYFIYGHALTSELFRESIVNFFEDNDIDMDDTIMTDAFSGRVRGRYEPNKGFVVKESNPESLEGKKTLDEKENIEESIKELDEKERKNHSSEYYTSKTAEETANEMARMPFDGSWDISDKIQAMFLEKSYAIFLQQTPEGLEDKASQMVSSVFAPVESSIDSALYQKMEIPGYGSGTLHGRRSREVGDLPRPGGIENAINAVSAITSSDENIQKALEEMGLNDSDLWGNLLYAAAAASSGQGEYTETSNSWEPRTSVSQTEQIPFAYTRDGRHASSLEDAIENGIILGLSGVRLVSRKQYSKITGKKQSVISDHAGDYVFLDTYYAERATEEEILEHKINILLNTGQLYAYAAFFRQVLFWAKYLYEHRISPSFWSRSIESYADSMSFTQGLEALSEADPNWRVFWGLEDTYVGSDEFDETVDMLRASPEATRRGNAFICVFTALVNGDPEFLDHFRQRSYGPLNDFILSTHMSKNPYAHDARENNPYIPARRFVLALAATNLTSGIGSIGQSIPNPGDQLRRLAMEQVYLAQAEDPRQYILHSFYDMIVNDARGRMLRAFPTFYMIMIDEGSKIGMWKLHDNFYNINAIQDIQVTKSRKNPADLAQITMTNMFSSFTTDDEDIKEDYEYDFRDIFNQMFRRRAAFLKQDQLRRDASQPHRIQLHTGIRINLRMGYGSNGAELPTVFNGTVTELGVGESITLIAQSDGIELTNPIMLNEDGDNMENRDSFFISRFFQNFLSDGATPKTILNSLLTAQGGWLKKTIKTLSDGRFFNYNPFGIINFGDPHVRTVFQNGEPIQNIYESIDRPVWGENSAIAGEYALDSPPKISMSIFGKSFWDILHICTSASPDFICGVAPFGLRSTVFHGAPHYYYAYDYMRTSEGTIREKRKPYQQYHIYTSYSDIIANNITTSDREMRTAAVGLYNREGFLSGGRSDSVGPIWADFEIYPERQKTTTVDTQLYSKGYTRLSRFAPFLNWTTNRLDDSRGKNVAWRMTAYALKESVKEMYQGELMVLGDPTVKPHDRMFITDSYENMSGQCLVESVSHVMNLETGFVSAVYADAIATVDDQHELAKQTLAGSAAAKGAAASVGLIATSYLYGRTYAPTAKMTAKFARNSLNRAVRLARRTPASKYVRALSMKAKKLKLTQRIKWVSAAKFGPIGVGVMIAAEMGVFMIASKLVYEAIERKMKSYRAIQVFPLKKNGRVYTAGLNGSKGIVYGSPSYDDPGVIGNLFQRLVGAKANPGPLEGIIGLAQDIFVSDGMEQIVKDKFMREERLIDDHGNLLIEPFTTDLMRTMAVSEAQNVNSYYAAIHSKRVDDPSERSVYDQYTAESSEKIEIILDTLKNLSLIEDNPRLKKHREEGRFMMIHGEESEHQLPYKIFNVKLESESREVKGVLIDDYFDLPILDKDAVSILAKSVDRMIGENANKSSGHVNLISALQPDMDGYASTGFEFIVKASNGEAYKKVLDEIIEEQKKACEGKQHIRYEEEDEGVFIIMLDPPRTGY